MSRFKSWVLHCNFQSRVLSTHRVQTASSCFQRDVRDLLSNLFSTTRGEKNDVTSVRATLIFHDVTSVRAALICQGRIHNFSAILPVSGNNLLGLDEQVPLSVPVLIGMLLCSQGP